jgi:hypothetical protein
MAYLAAVIAIIITSLVVDGDADSADPSNVEQALRYLHHLCDHRRHDQLRLDPATWRWWWTPDVGFRQVAHSVNVISRPGSWSSHAPGR